MTYDHLLSKKAVSFLDGSYLILFLGRPTRKWQKSWTKSRRRRRMQQSVRRTLCRHPRQPYKLLHRLSHPAMPQVARVLAVLPRAPPPLRPSRLSRRWSRLRELDFRGWGDCVRWSQVVNAMWRRRSTNGGRPVRNKTGKLWLTSLSELDGQRTMGGKPNFNNHIYAYRFLWFLFGLEYCDFMHTTFQCWGISHVAWNACNLQVWSTYACMHEGWGKMGLQIICWMMQSGPNRSI